MLKAKLICRFSILAFLITAGCGAPDDRTDVPANFNLESNHLIAEEVRLALDSIDELDGSIQVQRSSARFVIEQSTFFCVQHPVIADDWPPLPVGGMGVAGISDALLSIGQDPMFEGSLRTAPSNAPPCKSADAIQYQTYLDLNKLGRPFRMAVAFWQNDAWVIATIGRDMDPQDSNTWGDLPYRPGGPQFEDVLRPAMVELSSQVLSEVLNSEGGGE